jgi:hypothetical protein
MTKVTSKTTGRNIATPKERERQGTNTNEVGASGRREKCAIGSNVLIAGACDDEKPMNPYESPYRVHFRVENLGEYDPSEHGSEDNKDKAADADLHVSLHLLGRFEKSEELK